VARTGRFGRLPGRAPDLTSTIVALIEAAAAQDDRNIMSAWTEGGTFRGKKVTDQMVRQWFAQRRSQYTKDDPEYDYWNQQLQQIDYDIGESKMLVRAARGEKSDYAYAANWYRTNAKRFPRNSEAYREAMRNAAGYQKAAQENAHAARTVSDYEKFSSRVNALQKSKVDPAMRAVSIVDEALHRMGFSDFMSLDATQKANAKVALEDFIRNDEDGRRMRRQWKRLTGTDFTYNSLRRVIREGKRGSTMQAEVARKYGYSPAQFVQGAQNFETYDTSLAIFRSDVLADYMETTQRYEQDLKDAKSPEERNAIRATYAQAVRGYEKQAMEVGDTVLAGQLRGKRKVVSGEGGGTFDNPFPEDTLNPQAGTSTGGDDTVYLDAKGAFDTTRYDTKGEYESAFAKWDQQSIEGLQKGTHVYVLEPDGRLNVVDVAKLAPTVQQYGSFQQPLDAGGSTMVYVEKKQVVVRFKSVGGGQIDIVMPGWTEAQIDGVTVYFGPTSISDGVVKPTLVPPWSDEGIVDNPGYRTKMERAGEGREETITYQDPQTGANVKRTSHIVDINVSIEEFAQMTEGKPEGITEAEWAQTILDRQRAAAGGAIAGEAPTATELGTRPGRGTPPGAPGAAPQAEPGVGAPGTEGQPAPPATTPREPTDAEVDAVFRRMFTVSLPEQEREMKNIAEPGSGDIWWDEQQRLAREEAQRLISIEFNPQSGQPNEPPQVAPAPAAAPAGRTYAIESPLVFSGALTSEDDQTGATVAAMSSQKHWAEHVRTTDPTTWYESLIKANGIDPTTDPERAAALADEVNQIFTLGAWGQDELEFAFGRPKSSLGDVARDAFDIAGVIFRNATRTPVGQDVRDQFIEQVTGGATTLSPDEAKQKYPGLAEDIDTSVKRREMNEVRGLPWEEGFQSSFHSRDEGMWNPEKQAFNPWNRDLPLVMQEPVYRPPAAAVTTAPTGEVLGPPAPVAGQGALPFVSAFRDQQARYAAARFTPAAVVPKATPPPVGGAAPSLPPNATPPPSAAPVASYNPLPQAPQQYGFTAGAQRSTYKPYGGYARYGAGSRG
jgi:hypothetical protein